MLFLHGGSYVVYAPCDSVYRSLASRLALQCGRGSPEHKPNNLNKVIDILKISNNSLLLKLVEQLSYNLFPVYFMTFFFGWLRSPASVDFPAMVKLPAVGSVDQGLCVLSIDYRLAPEHLFPKAFEDGAKLRSLMSGFQWGANAGTTSLVMSHVILM